MTEPKPRGDSARAQRIVVALATVALLLTGVGLAVAGGVGPAETQSGSVVIRTVRPVEAVVVVRPAQPATASVESEKKPATDDGEASAVVDESPGEPSETPTRKSSGKKSAPAVAEEDDDDEREVVGPSVRDDDDDGEDEPESDDDGDKSDDDHEEADD